MSQTYSRINSQGGPPGSLLHDEPSICPLCKHAIKPVEKFAYINNDSQFSILYECPSCISSFIKTGQAIVHTSGLREVTAQLYPIVVDSVSFKEYIKEISPSFIEIFNQAYAAEQYRLLEICGIGYRKALEFLIKDYLVHTKDASLHDAIKTSSLSTCIKNYVTNPQIQTVAKPAVWLGNDETHYVRKFDGEQLDTLKRLIRLTVLWIEMEHETAEAALIEPK